MLMPAKFLWEENKSKGLRNEGYAETFAFLLYVCSLANSGLLDVEPVAPKSLVNDYEW